MRYSKWVWLVVLAALCGLACPSRTVVRTEPEGEPVHGADEGSGSSGKDKGPETGPDGELVGSAVQLEVPQVKAPEGFEVKLDGNLLALVRAWREGGEVAVAAAVRAANVEMTENRVRVGVTVTGAEQVAEMKQKIGELGGKVTVEFENRVFALVPVGALEPLAKEEAVWSLAVPQRIVSPFDGK